MGIFTDKFINNFNESSFTYSRSLSVVEEAESNPENVRIYTDKNGKNYIPTLDLEQYMVAAGISSVDEAVDNILSVNPFITKENTIIASNGCSEAFLEQLVEQNSMGVMLEKAVEDEAMSVKQAKKYLNKLLSDSKSKASTKEEIKLKIQILEKCVKDMKAQLKDTDKNFGHTKYVLKDLFIPFNGIYRFFAKGDKYAGLGTLANMVIPGSGGLVRAVTYQKMLNQYIERTEETIQYLKKELKKM